MSHNQTLIIAVLIAVFLPRVSFSQEPVVASSDPYFAPRSVKVPLPQTSEQTQPLGFVDPTPQLSPLKQKRGMPVHEPHLVDLKAVGSNSNSDFVPPPKPLDPIVLDEQADFRPTSISARGTESDGSGTRLPGEGIAKPKVGFAPQAPAGSGTNSGSDTRSGSGTRVATTPQLSQPAGNQTSESIEEFAPGQVVAIVGGEPLFVGDMLFEANQMIDQRAAGAPEDVKKQLRHTLIKRLIPKFVDSKMLWVDAVSSLPEGADIETVLESASAEFDSKALPEIMKRTGAESVQEFDAKLRVQGSSLRQFRSKWGREQLMRFALSQKLQIDTDVSHNELLAYYRENQESYLRKARVRWEELAIRYSKTPDRAEARRLITGLGNEVVYGASFEAVAKRGSQGFTAFEGGKHDWIGRGALVYTEVESALFSIPVGKLSEIIESRDGLHIVRVIEREEDSVTPFTEAQAEIRTKLENEKRTAEFDKHLAQLRKRVPFEILIPDVELPPHLAEQDGAYKGSWK